MWRPLSLLFVCGFCAVAVGQKADPLPLAVYTQQDGLPSDSLTSLYTDPEGYLWIGTTGGTVRFDGQRFLMLQPPAGLDTARSLFVTDFQGGRWQGTRGQGLWQLSVPQDTVPPRVLLVGLAVNGKGVPLSSPSFLFSTDDTLTCTVQGIDFSRRGQLQYRYRLLGADSAFTPPTLSASATYHHLPGGTYMFQAQAIGRRGALSIPTPGLRLRVKPALLRQSWFQMLFIVLGLATVVGSVWYYTRRQLMLRIRALELQRQLEAERTRISRDLHDNIGAQLTSILSGLEMTGRLGAREHPRLAELIEALQQDARLTIGQLRETIWAIRQPTILLEELLAQFQGFVQRQLLYHHGLHYSQHAPQGTDQLALRPLQALGLFRVMQEALQNAVKHASATELTLTAKRTAAGMLEIAFADNGKGMGMALTVGEPGSLGHYGLENMRHRMEELGGSFQMAATPGGGTTVVLRLPLQPSPTEIPPNAG